MAIKQSAKKALRQSEKRKKRNLARKRAFKDSIKKMGGLVSQKKIKEARELLPKIYKALDKAAKTGVIKKNSADRKKSRITKLVNRPS